MKKKSGKEKEKKTEKKKKMMVAENGLSGWNALWINEQREAKYPKKYEEEKKTTKKTNYRVV